MQFNADQKEYKGGHIHTEFRFEKPFRYIDLKFLTAANPYKIKNLSHTYSSFTFEIFFDSKFRMVVCALGIP